MLHQLRRQFFFKYATTVSRKFSSQQTRLSLDQVVSEYTQVYQTNLLKCQTALYAIENTKKEADCFFVCNNILTKFKKNALYIHDVFKTANAPHCFLTSQAADNFVQVCQNVPQAIKAQEDYYFFENLAREETNSFTSLFKFMNSEEMTNLPKLTQVMFFMNMILEEKKNEFELLQNVYKKPKFQSVQTEYLLHYFMNDKLNKSLQPKFIIEALKQAYPNYFE